MSAIPSAVRRQAEEAERLAVEHGLKGAPPAEGGGGEGEPKAGQEPEKPAETPTQTADPAPKAEPKKVDPEDYKERFSRYKAQTDQTIAEQRGQIQAMQQQLAESQRQIQELIAKLQEQQAAAPEAGNGPESASADDVDLSSLPADLREEYDENFLRAMARLNNHQLVKMVGDLKAELDALKGTVTTVAETQQKSAKELYYEALDREVPNWEEIGADPAFIEWLNNRVSEVDPRTYGEILREGDETANATMTLWVLNQYLGKSGGAQNGNGATNTDNAQPGVNNNLDTMLTPEGAGGGNGSANEALSPTVETFTQSEVQQFYKDWAIGKKYTEAEALAIDRQIQAAQKAGKIIPG